MLPSTLPSRLGNRAFTRQLLARTRVDDLVADKPWIYTCTVRRYEDDLQFGHEITIDVAINSPDQLFWLEKTDKPYVAGMEAGQWTDMYGLAGSNSDVFQEWVEAGDRRRMRFVDPPSIRKTPNNSRTLEFFLHFVGDDNAVVITARQALETDGEGTIRKHDFAFLAQRISEDDRLSNPTWDD